MFESLQFFLCFIVFSALLHEGNSVYLKRGLAMFILCLLICSPVQKNTDTTLLEMYWLVPSIRDRMIMTFFMMIRGRGGYILILALLYRAEM